MTGTTLNDERRPDVAETMIGDGTIVVRGWCCDPVTGVAAAIAER